MDVAEQTKEGLWSPVTSACSHVQRALGTLPLEVGAGAAMGQAREVREASASAEGAGKGGGERRGPRVRLGQRCAYYHPSVGCGSHQPVAGPP